MSSEEDGYLSESATKELVGILIQRGYFQNGVEPQLANADRRDDPPVYSELDCQCQLVSTQAGTCSSYMRRDQLKRRLSEALFVFGGRLSISHAAIALAVNQAHIQHISETTPSVIRVGDDLITEQHMDQLALETGMLLRERKGFALVSEVATTVWRMPVDTTSNALNARRLGLFSAKTMTLHGSKALVTPTWEEQQLFRVRGVFRGITLPTQIDAVCQEFHWDLAYVVLIIKDLCETKQVLGEVHVSDTCITGAVFIPQIYQMMQRKAVDEYFATNGYLTKDRCLAMGVLESKMGEYIQEAFSNAIVLSNSVITRDAVVSPVEQALIEAIANDTFVDLSLHIPQSIMPYEQDVQKIVDLAASASSSDGHCMVNRNGEALVVSPGMVRHIRKTLIPPLIASFAKVRAEQLMSSDAMAQVVDEDNDEPATSDKKQLKKKGKKPSRKAKSTAPDFIRVNRQGDVVPLIVVARVVAAEYPDLADIQTVGGRLYDEGDEIVPTWEEAEDAIACDGPIYELCRRVVYVDDFQSSCEKAIHAELERLESAKASSSVRSRKDRATKFRSIESAFESPACFNAACYSIQSHAKFLQYAAASPDFDENDLSVLEKDFLCGPCANFTSRITQYCFFRNEIEEGVFSIKRSSQEGTYDDEVENDVPAYCRPVDLATRRYPTIRLCCIHRLPLPTLRESLPGNIGVALARMWTLCGGTCYEGGSRVSEDGTEISHPGDAEAFQSHVMENCLAICGVPFKAFDRKAEKQYLFDRRKELTEALEASTDANIVLELTIMLLFQQLKSLVVSGPHLCGPILLLLQKEKRLPENMSKLLGSLAESIHSKVDPNEALVRATKACGLSRDISKHVAEYQL